MSQQWLLNGALWPATAHNAARLVPPTRVGGAARPHQSSRMVPPLNRACCAGAIRLDVASHPVAARGAPPIALPAPPPPAYSFRDINLAPRTGVETCVFVKIAFNAPGVLGQLPTPWPDDNDIAEIFAAMRSIALNNAYSRTGFDLAHIPNWSGTVRSPVFEFTGMPPPPRKPADRVIDVVWKVLDSGAGPYPGWSIASADHIIVFWPATPGQKENLGATNQFVFYPIEDVNVPPAKLTNNRSLLNQEAAAGITHEMGHGDGLGHANTFRAWEITERKKVYNYGDLFDYMGGMAQDHPRFDSACWPSQPPPIPNPLFANPTDIHVNPIHKLQHGWIDPAEIMLVPPGNPSKQVVPLAGITNPYAFGSGAYYAVQIHRQFVNPKGAMDVPTSLLVYWRNNEPLARDGVCVAVVSREWLTSTTQLIELFKGRNLGTACKSPSNFKATVFPAWNVSIAEQAEWTDPVSGAKIKCLGKRGGLASGPMDIEVTVPSTAESFTNIPVLDIRCPAIESGEVLTNGVTIAFQVMATNPYNNPNFALWKDIARVEVELFTANETGPTVLQYLHPTGGLRLASFTFRTAELAIAGGSVVAGSLQLPTLSPPPLRRALGLRATAFTKLLGGVERRVEGKMTFLIDQTR